MGANPSLKTFLSGFQLAANIEASSLRKRRSPSDSAIPCSTIITCGTRLSAQQLYRSVHPLDTVARVATSLRASLYSIWPVRGSD